MFGLHRLVSFLLMITAMVVTAGVIFLVPALSEIFEVLYKDLEAEIPALTSLSIDFSNSTIMRIAAAVIISFIVLVIEIFIPSRSIASLFHIAVIWVCLGVFFLSISSYTIPFLEEMATGQATEAPAE